MKELNINRFLMSAERSDVRGYNIYSFGKDNIDRPYGERQRLKKWNPPSLGVRGMVSIGHELEKCDLIYPEFSVNGEKIELCPIRNTWTPAYMETIYRSSPQGEYKKSGLYAVKELKCFNAEDSFISEITFSNDSREIVTVNMTLSLPYERVSECAYKLEARVVPRSLQREMSLSGFAIAKTSMGESASFTVSPFSSFKLKYCFSFSKNSLEIAEQMAKRALAEEKPHINSELRFNSWFEKYAPKLDTADGDMLKVYYYRFFLIKCAIHTPSDVLYDSDYEDIAVYESPFGEWFGAPVGLPFPLQIEEMKWMRDKGAVTRHAENWCSGFGCTHGYIQFTPMAIYSLYLQTGDKTILEKAYPAVKSYTMADVDESDAEKLPETTGSWITGAEYNSPFYQYTTPPWDWRWDNQGAKMGFPKTTLFRLDKCSMHALNLMACEKIADVLGLSEDAQRFSKYRKGAVSALTKLFWDGERKFFFDAFADTKKRCFEAYSYGGFMPLMYNILGGEYRSVFAELGEGGRFDTGFSPSSVGKDCPMYWFDNCITGPTAASLSEPHEYPCSWNGPVWPFATSLILDSLGRAARECKDLEDTFDRIFNEYTSLHFDFGDRSTPVICESYRPTDGLSFSPYTEYFHSEWLNLFFSHYLGISVEEDGSIRFSPITNDEFEVSYVEIRGKNYRFLQRIENGSAIRIMEEI